MRFLVPLLALAASAGCKSSFPKMNEPADAGEPEDAAREKACAPSGLSKGPWTVAPTETSIKIRWETCKPGLARKVTISAQGGPGDAGADAAASSVEAESIEKPFDVKNTYEAPFGLNAPPDVAGTWYMHEAEVKNLAPSTCYSYALAVDEAAKGRFCTARLPGESFRFMAIGDTNPTLGDKTTKTLAAVLPYAPDFAIHGGDVQYYASTLETWAAWFPLMAPLLRNGALQISIGNHESEKDDELQGYTLRFFGGAGFDGGETWFRFSSGGVWFFSIDTEQPHGPGSPQGDWLARSLADAAQKPGHRFSVVYFHKPFVTCGDTSQDSGAKNYFSPIFEQNKVALVVQAHMHGYERFELGPITYVTSAGGGGRMGDVNQNKDRPECASRRAAGPWFHALLVDVMPGKLRGQAIDESGAVADSFEKTVP
jgi:hypothetical protein